MANQLRVMLEIGPKGKTAYHTLDHTWEMEDKDLAAGVSPCEPQVCLNKEQ